MSYPNAQEIRKRLEEAKEKGFAEDQALLKETRASVQNAMWQMTEDEVRMEFSETYTKGRIERVMPIIEREIKAAGFKTSFDYITPDQRDGGYPFYRLSIKLPQ